MSTILYFVEFVDQSFAGLEFLLMVMTYENDFILSNKNGCSIETVDSHWHFVAKLNESSLITLRNDKWIIFPTKKKSKKKYRQ